MKNSVSLGLLFLFAIFLCGFKAPAQKTPEKKGIFVRIYNLEGKKITKGRVAGVTDAQIELVRGEASEKVSIIEIGFIRTKHSVGHNILLGSIAGSAIAAAGFASEADPDAWLFGYTAAEGVLAGFILGAPVGGALGALTSLFKEQKKYEINGQQDKWLEIKDGFMN